MEAVVFGLAWARARFLDLRSFAGRAFGLFFNARAIHSIAITQRAPSPGPAALNTPLPAFRTAASSARPGVMSRVLLRLGRGAPITSRPLHRLAQAPPVACSWSSKVTL